LKFIIMVVDIRHNPTADDKQMAEWIRYNEVPVLLAASKADKLGKTRINPQALSIRKLLGFSNNVPVIPYSVVTKQGLDELLSYIDSYT